ncbi:MAG: hypothetical protein ACRDGL_06090 [Candidatus Limnocylindrales bacterium]
MGLDVRDLVFDDDNEAKFATHHISVDEVEQVLDKAPRFFVNRLDRRASHVMVGPTLGGRLLVVPLEDWGGDGYWRPVTAFDATAREEQRYSRR